MNAIWVDTDGYTAAWQYKACWLTSVLKGISDAVTRRSRLLRRQLQRDLVHRQTLAKRRPGLAPFTTSSRKSRGADAELTTVKQGIIDGTIAIKSKAQPKS